MLLYAVESTEVALARSRSEFTDAKSTGGPSKLNLLGVRWLSFRLFCSQRLHVIAARPAPTQTMAAALDAVPRPD